MSRSGRIVLATGGSLGDIHPVIAVGRALQDLGFKAEIATACDYRAKIELEGLTFHEVGPSLARLEADTGLNLAGLTDRIARSDRFLFEEVMLAYAAESTHQMIAAAEGAVGVLGLSFAPAARIAAERLCLPFITASLQPTTVFSAYDPPTLPKAPWLRPARSGPGLWLNRATLAAGRLTTAAWTRRLNEIRSGLGVGPCRGDLFFDGLKHADLALGLYSPLLSPRQSDAPANYHVVGYAPYDSEAGGPAALPDALMRFLDAGAPPVVFTLGSAAVNIPGDFYHHGLNAARAAGRRAVLLVGANGDTTIADGEDVIAIPYAPFSLLFPRAAAIVHQGGVGTVQQALRAGVPQIVVPHLGDQYDNAARIVRMGCGRSIKLKDYAAAIGITLPALLADQGIGAQCTTIGTQARIEDGAAVAARLVVQTLKP